MKKKQKSKIEQMNVFHSLKYAGNNVQVVSNLNAFHWIIPCLIYRITKITD